MGRYLDEEDKQVQVEYTAMILKFRLKQFNSEAYLPVDSYAKRFNSLRNDFPSRKSKDQSKQLKKQIQTRSNKQNEQLVFHGKTQLGMSSAQ
ncbi:hypothetical protein ABZP36_011384, partial [Zizania latifolia]